MDKGVELDVQLLVKGDVVCGAVMRVNTLSSVLTGVFLSKSWLTLFLQEPTLRLGV